MPKIPAAFAALAVLLFLSGCMVETATFLSDPDNASADNRLIGTWQPADPGKKDNGKLVVSLNKTGPGGTLDVSLVSPDPTEKPGRLTIWSTKHGGLTFLNVKGEDPEKKDEDLLTIAAYRFASNGDLEIALLDAKAFAALVEAGRLKGKISRSFGIVGVKLAAPRQALLKALGNAESDGLFSFDKASGVLRMKRAK